MRAEWARKAAEAHGQAFHLAKAPRKLAFAPALGAVELDLVVGSATLNFSVSPVLAAIILPFQDHESMSAVDLEKATNIPMDVLLRKYDALALRASPAVCCRWYCVCTSNRQRIGCKHCDVRVCSMGQGHATRNSAVTVSA